MKLSLKIHFDTDGDFSVDNYDTLFNPKAPLYSQANVSYSAQKGFEEYDFVLECDGKEDDCLYASRDLLESLVCNVRVAPHHYWLIPELYNFLIRPKEQLWTNDNVSWSEFLSGNHYLTNLSLSIDR